MLTLQFPLHSVFLALPLEGDALLCFQMLQQQLREFGDCLRFQNPETSHLTLMYWREVMEIEHGQIVTQADKIASRHAPFSLQVDGVGTFGTRSEDHILYLAVTFSPELALLKKSCPWTDGRSFTPHITLARVAHPGRFAVVKKKVLRALGRASFHVRAQQLRLYAEVQGTKQTQLQDFLLRAP